MSNAKKISRLQLDKMADFMEKNPKLFQGHVEKDFTKLQKENLWRELAELLNAEGKGPRRSVEKWRKCFKDYKCYLKKKYHTYLQDQSKPCHFDSLDARYLKMMGFEDLQGIEENDFKNSTLQSYLLEEVVDLGVTDTAEYKEQSHKFYQAPNIITLLQTVSSAKPAPSSLENTPTRTQLPSVEKTQRESLSSSSSTAEALHAIAKEMGVKNRLAKRKIDLLEESLLLEKRKIEAFELIAKRLPK